MDGFVRPLEPGSNARRRGCGCLDFVGDGRLWLLACLAHVVSDREVRPGLSLGHRVNLLASRLTHVGLAAHVLGPYLLVTQLFGELVAREVWVRSPRSTEEFDVGFGRSAHGAYPLALERRGTTHVAMFSPRSGPGDYQLLIGPSSDRLLITGVRLCVR